MQNPYEWHRWFAWYPVWIPLPVGRNVWLRRVECRVHGEIVQETESYSSAGDLTEWWEYRLPQ